MVFQPEGRLDHPAQGQILKRFGEDDGLGGDLRGLAVATRARAQVTPRPTARLNLPALSALMVSS